MRRSVCLFISICVLQPLSGSGQWTASGYIGKIHTQNTDIHVIRRPDTDLFLHDVPFEDRSFRGPLYYGMRARYMFRPPVGLEGEFIHTKVFARLNEPLVASGIEQYNISHGLNLLIGNFVLRPELTPRLSLALRAGLGVAIAHPEIRAFGQSLNGYQHQGTALHFAGGAEFELNRRLFWLAEYKFTSTNSRFELGPGRIENGFATHHVITGLGLRF